MDKRKTKSTDDAFEVYRFYVVPTDQPEEDRKLIQVLEKHRAINVGPQRLLSSNNRGKNKSAAPIDYAAIVISPTIDFPEYRECVTKRIQVVTPQWVWDSIDRNMPLMCRPYSPDPKHIFAKDYFVVAGLAYNDVEAIQAVVHCLGGQYSAQPHTLTTHIITTKFDHPYCQLVRQTKPSVKIVLPHWIDDCLKFNRRLDETPYLLPKPAVFNNSGLETYDYENVSLGEGPNSTRFNDTTSPQQQTQQQQSQVVDFPHDLMKNRKFYLDANLSLSNRQKSSIQKIICQAGGSIMEDMDRDASPTPSLNVYIGEWRSGSSYVAASRRGWVVANLRWLYWVITNKEWKSPTKDLLHYPKVYGGMPDLHGYKISITNFTGELRSYVKELVDSLGAMFETGFCDNHKLLIAGWPDGRKYNAAKKWNINVVNLLWLEETYAKWQVQAFTSRKYLSFPRIGDITTAVGPIELDAQALKRFYMTPQEISMDEAGRHVKPNGREKIAKPVDEINGKESKKDDKEFSEEQQRQHKPAEEPLLEKSAESSYPTNEEPQKPKESKEPVELAGPQLSPQKSEKQHQISTPSPKKSGESTRQSSGRRAKDAALSKLHLDMKDLNDYEKTRRRNIHNLPLPDEEQESNRERSSKRKKSDGREGESDEEDMDQQDERRGDEGSPSKKRSLGSPSRAITPPAKKPKHQQKPLPPKSPLKRQLEREEHGPEEGLKEGETNEETEVKSEYKQPQRKKEKEGEEQSSMAETKPRVGDGSKAAGDERNSDSESNSKKLKKQVSSSNKHKWAATSGNGGEQKEEADGDETVRATAGATTEAHLPHYPAKTTTATTGMGKVNGNDVFGRSRPAHATYGKSSKVGAAARKRKVSLPSSGGAEGTAEEEASGGGGGVGATGTAEVVGGSSSVGKSRASASGNPGAQNTIDLTESPESVVTVGSTPEAHAESATSRRGGGSSRKGAAASGAVAGGASKSGTPTPTPPGGTSGRRAGGRSASPAGTGSGTSSGRGLGAVTVLHTPMKLLLTNVGMELTGEQIGRMARLGVQVTQDPRQATHVVAPRVSRTEKFIVALARAPRMLVPQFVRDLQAALQPRAGSSEAEAPIVIDPEDEKYRLQDGTMVSTYGADLDTVLRRASAARGMFLQGLVFNMTPDIKGGFDVMDRIVAAHGAKPCVVVRSPAKVARTCKPSSGDRMILIVRPEQHEYIEAFLKAFGNGARGGAGSGGEGEESGTGDEQQAGSGAQQQPATRARKRATHSYTPMIFTQDWLLRSILGMSMDFTNQLVKYE